MSLQLIVNLGPVAIGCYCVLSILMTVTNKFVVNGDDFNLNFFLLAIQQTVCLAAIAGLKLADIITYRLFNKTEAKQWLPIAIMLVVMIYTSLKALQFLLIPVYTIFKNLTIILIAYGEVIWFGGKVTLMALGSFLLMVMSLVLACYGDNSPPKTDIGGINLGYVWMFANCMLSAGFVLYMRVRIKLTNFKDFDTMYYNNLLSIPVLLIASFTLEDWSYDNLQLNFPESTRNVLIFSMIFSGMSSIGISYCSGWCVRVTSSTTYSMVGALNKLPIALSGLVFFDADINFWSVTSIMIGFVSGIVYAVAKEQQKKQAAPTLPTTKE